MAKRKTENKKEIKNEEVENMDKQEDKKGMYEVQMVILLQRIEDMVVGLPKYLKENIAFSSVLQAREELAPVIQLKLDKLEEAGVEYVDNECWVDDIMKPVITRATDIMYEKLDKEYPFALLEKEAKDEGITVYEMIDD